MSQTNRERVERIVELLQEVRSRHLTCFGSDTHRFRLRKPVSESTFSTAEANLGITLPDDFRAFYTHVGNGGAPPHYLGAGPHHGVYSLDYCVRNARSRDGSFRFDPHQPCLLHPDLPRTDDWIDQMPNDSPYQGTLVFGTQGCSYEMVLILNGPFRGRVAYIDAEETSPPHVVYELDFLAWYERWLSELLLGYNIDNFGHFPGGDENELFDMIANPDSSDNCKADAGWAIGHLPRLSDAGALQVTRLLRHPVAGVRNAAGNVLRVFSLRSAEEECAQLLSDSDRGVRRSGILTLLQFDPNRWAPAVLSVVYNDPDPAVARMAFDELARANQLSTNELLSMLDQRHPRHVREWAMSKLTRQTEDVGLLILFLSESEPYLRRQALDGLRRLKPDSAVRAVLDLLAREPDETNIDRILKFLGELGNPLAVPALLEWAVSPDDYHRLGALEALSKIGDERAVPIARQMLAENRKPERPGESHTRTIGELVRQHLAESPNAALRALAD